MNLGQFTEPRLLVPRLSSEWRDSAISELSQRFEIAGRVKDAASFTHSVLDHESLVSVVIDGVAFPLARGSCVRQLSFAIGFSPLGIRWGVERTPVVETIVLFAVPPIEGQSYPGLVLTFSRLLKDKSAFDALRRCAEPGEMWSVLQQVACIRTGPSAGNLLSQC